MIKIVMCDDDRFLLKLEEEQLEKEIRQANIDAKIVCMATSSKELFQFLKSNPSEYLFFLDLDFGLGELNGIDMARKIKKEYPASRIVFVTNHQEMAMQVLSSGVEPFGFLEKSTNMQAMRRGYHRYLSMAIASMEIKVEDEEEIRLIVGIDEVMSLKISQITYIETEKTVSHGITYHTMDNSSITVRDTMEHVSQMLKKDFLQCHRSILVNKKHIIGFEDNMIRLSNLELIHCAFRMKNEVKKCF